MHLGSHSYCWWGMASLPTQNTLRINCMENIMTKNWKKTWKNIHVSEYIDWLWEKFVEIPSFCRCRINECFVLIFSNHRHSHDVDWRIRILNDIPETSWVFFPRIHYDNCNPSHRMDNINARISSYWRFLYHSSHVFGVS